MLWHILNLLFQINSIKALSEMAVLINVNLQFQYLFNEHLLSVLSVQVQPIFGTLMKNTGEV